MTKTIIVGGGIAGLTLARILGEQGRDVTVLEKEDVVGGLARSFKYGDFIFDLGPHRFHTDRPAISDFIGDVLGDEAETIARKSGVWMFNRNFSWPLHPSVMFGLPPSVLFRVGLDLITTVYQRREIINFEDYIMNMYGRTLYEVFFKDYTEKFLGLSPSETHVDWARTGIDRAIIDKRLKMNSLMDLVINTLFKPKKETLFIYPKYGIGVFSQMLADMITGQGNTVVTGTAVDKLKIKDDGDKKRIKAVKAGKTWYEADEVVWTAPLPLLMDLLGEKHDPMCYLALLVFNIELSTPANTPFQWCYFGDKYISFNRVTNPELFSRTVVPPGKGSICVEITCRIGDETWNNPEMFYDPVVSDLVGTGVIDRPSQITGAHLEKVPNTYPVYSLDYRDTVKTSEDLLSNKYSHVFPAGRTGLFWYNNMDQSIEQAMELAGHIIADDKN